MFYIIQINKYYSYLIVICINIFIYMRQVTDTMLIRGQKILGLEIAFTYDHSPDYF